LKTQENATSEIYGFIDNHMTFNPENLTTPMLLQYYSKIIDELRTRKIIRTSNSPTGDFAEWLIANQLGLTLVENSTSGYDAIDSTGVKFQIKSRRVTSHNKSKQLGAIRNLESHDFDFLIAVFFNELFEVEKVVKIPHELIDKYAKYRKHVNAHILVLNDIMLRDPLVEDLTSKFNK
jgi:hypothetical protein